MSAACSAAREQIQPASLSQWNYHREGVINEAGRSADGWGEPGDGVALPWLDACPSSPTMPVVLPLEAGDETGSYQAPVGCFMRL